MKFVRRFLSDKAGATAMEYGLMISLLALVIVGAVSLVGSHLSSSFNTLGNQLK